MTTHHDDHQWEDDAACRDTDPAVFFPGSGGDSHEARDLCARCPTIVPCLAGAVERAEDHGIWGGHGPAELRKLRRPARRHGTLPVATAAAEAFQRRHEPQERPQAAPTDQDNVAVVLRFSRPERAIYDHLEETAR